MKPKRGKILNNARIPGRLDPDANHLRYKGEWFNPGPELQAHITQLKEDALERPHRNTTTNTR